MKVGLGLKVGTNLALTPQLHQAIRMLQLSSQDLALEIENVLMENPMLERDSADSELSDIDESASMLNNASTVNEKTDISGFDEPASLNNVDTQISDTHIKDELAIDTKWDDVYIHGSTKWDRAAVSDTSFEGKSSETLQSHLLWQMNLAKMSEMDEFICRQMIDNLDEKGLLDITLEELRDNLNVELAFNGIDYDIDMPELAVVLKRLQQFEPIGVAARNLPESLQIQLQAYQKDHDDFDAATTLLEHHELLIKNDLKNLIKQTQLSMDKIQAAIALIRTLEPYPAQDFIDSGVDYQIPDVIVKKVSDTWQVQLNNETLPKIKINNSYASLVKRGKGNADNEYLKNNLQHAKQFIRSVDERNNSLLKVATAIVQTQYEFFEHGVTALKPLILKEIAEMVDLHESTVSRITSNKYMLTATGLYELKYFFSSSVGNHTGEDASSTAICAMIKEMIESENHKKPLSDNAISQLLQNKGIDVARRTVAKYRESMGFPSSTNRKRLF